MLSEGPHPAKDLVCLAVRTIMGANTSKNASYGGPAFRSFEQGGAPPCGRRSWQGFGTGAACFVNAFFCFWRSFLRASLSFTRAAWRAFSSAVYFWLSAMSCRCAAAARCLLFLMQRVGGEQRWCSLSLGATLWHCSTVMQLEYSRTSPQRYRASTDDGGSREPAAAMAGTLQAS